MSILSSIRRLERSLLAVAAPAYCVVCGIETESRDAYPLCAACAESLRSRSQNGARLELCSVCGKPIVSELRLCTRCRKAEYAFDSAFHLYRYADAARIVMLAYKGKARRSLAGFLAGELAAVAIHRFPGRIIVPVPPRPGKLRRAGWDQVEDIARMMEKRHGVSVARILTRSGGVEQKALDYEGRAANMKGRMSLKPGAVAPLDPVLLDDVFTTGATLSACAMALKEAGAERVDALAIAAD